MPVVLKGRRPNQAVLKTDGREIMGEWYVVRLWRIWVGEDGERERGEEGFTYRNQVNLGHQ